MSIAIAGQYQLLPNLTDDEYAALKADIAARNAILVPVELDEQGAILDGHHRVRAWTELRAEGVKVADYPRMVRAGLDDTAKRAHVLALNLYRRHLSQDQRAPLVAELRRQDWGTAQIAQTAGVSEKTVRRDLDSVRTNDRTDLPKQAPGKDGKSYPTSKPRKAKTASIFAASPREEKRAIQAAAAPEALPDVVVGVQAAAQATRDHRRQERTAELATTPASEASTLPELAPPQDPVHGAGGLPGKCPECDADVLIQVWCGVINGKTFHKLFWIPPEKVGQDWYPEED